MAKPKPDGWSMAQQLGQFVNNRLPFWNPVADHIIGWGFVCAKIDATKRAKPNLLLHY
jgi:hypothetical protein